VELGEAEVEVAGFPLAKVQMCDTPLVVAGVKLTDWFCPGLAGETVKPGLGKFGGQF
jgi:hypothetical protein